MRKFMFVAALLSAGFAVGWTANGRSPTLLTAKPEKGARNVMISRPMEGGRKTEHLYLAVRPPVENDEGLRPDEWWIEVDGKVFLASPRP